MRVPRVARFLGHAQLAGIESSDHLLHGVAHFRIGRGRRDACAILEGGFDDLLQIVHVLRSSGQGLSISLRRALLAIERQMRADALGAFEAILERRHQRHAHEIASGIDSARFAGEIAARQYSDIIVGVQAAGELGIGGWRAAAKGRTPLPAMRGRAMAAATRARAQIFSRYMRRLSTTCASSPQAAMLAIWIGRLIALPW
jgi:hypothetical protein